MFIFEVKDWVPTTRAKINLAQKSFNRAFMNPANVEKVKRPIKILFSRHFADQFNLARNDPPLTVHQIAYVLQRVMDGPHIQAKLWALSKRDGETGVLKGKNSNIHMPFVLSRSPDGKSFEIEFTTVIRKRGFVAKEPKNRVFTVAASLQRSALNLLEGKRKRKRKRKKRSHAEKLSGIQMAIHGRQAMSGAGEHGRDKSKAGRSKSACRGPQSGEDN